MVHCIASSLGDDLNVKLRDSPYISIIVDETTDISVESLLAIYAMLYCPKSHQFETHFVGLTEMQKCDAASIEKAIKAQLDIRGLTYENVIGFGSDGASVMTGSTSGVAARLKAANPKIQSVHCSAHRLNLASSQAADSIPYLQRYQRIVSSIYNMTAHSSQKKQAVEHCQQILQDPKLQLKRIHDIRWLSLETAISTIQRTLPSLTMFIENQAAEGYPEAVGLEKQVISFKFLATTHFLVDALKVISRLSIIFQARNINFAIVKASLDASIAELEAMKTSDGVKLSCFMNALDLDGKFGGKEITRSELGMREFNSLRQTFITKLVGNIQQRFPTPELYEAMGVLIPHKFPRLADELSQYGRKEIATLLSYYSPKQDTLMETSEPSSESSAISPSSCSSHSQVSPQEIDAEEVYSEWEFAKTCMRTNFKSFQPSQQLASGSEATADYKQALASKEIWANFFRSYSDMCPNLLKLVIACYLLPMSSAECERCFSAVNRIKTKQRASLKPETLESLLFIRIEGPATPKEFDFTPALRKWRNMSNRRIL